ncbi:sensor histidine kinase [Arthrobacter rhizosphaerae]|uniref:sensor histidine kinase n=1 Tax=Arthrobacter rhizosphaerae TaxID=2855490 RepID=UPI001FF51E13|nr:HAMP domain-containing sensor histidine kinase [Arthrobacter rhizosphaerae]
MQAAELFGIVAWALLWAVVIGGASMLVLRSLRRTSLAIQISVAVLATVAVLTAGMVSAFNAMFISARDLEVMWYILAIAAVVAVAMSLMLGARVSRNARALADAARDLGHGKEAGTAVPVMSSELAALAEELQLSSRRLEESRQREAAVEKSRRELVSWISHDLRTPLASMRAMAEALEDGMAEDAGSYHRQIISQTDQMAGMVNDLLELSKIQAGTLQLTSEPLDLYDLASDAIADLAPLAAQRNIRLDGGGERECLAVADGPSLGRAIRNVVLNAILYSARDSLVHVEVGRDGKDAMVSVRDSCGGIAEEDLKHVFETGWQKDLARSRAGQNRGTVTGTLEDGRTPYSGAGVGLSMVAGIVRSHGGTVSVHNVGEGCRFSIRIPAEGSKQTGLPGDGNQGGSHGKA